MIVFNSRKAFAIWCMKQIALCDETLPRYIKGLKELKKAAKVTGQSVDIFETAIRYYDFYLVDHRFRVD